MLCPPFSEDCNKLVDLITILSMEFGWSYNDYMQLTVPQLQRYYKSLLENKKSQNKMLEETQEELFRKYITNQKGSNMV
jgi:hypothetical protein